MHNVTQECKLIDETTSLKGLAASPDISSSRRSILESIHVERNPRRVLKRKNLSPLPVDAGTNFLSVPTNQTEAEKAL